MEFGADFDDDLFGKTKEKSRNVAMETYTAKLCEPHWYQDESVDTPGDMHTIHKYRGDAAYYHKQYHVALQHYNQCLAVIRSTNIPMWKDVQESRARCYMHLDQLHHSLDAASQLTSLANNYDQKSTSLYLMADIYRKFHKVTDELSSVQGLLTLHVSNPHLWLRLAHIYTTLHQLQRTTEANHTDTNSCDGSDETIQECGTTATRALPGHITVCTCLYQTRCLLRNVQHTVKSFAKERNIKLQEQVDQQLQELELTEEIRAACIKFIYQYNEDEMPQSDSEKVEALQNLSRSSFESQWFSWYIQR